MHIRKYLSIFLIGLVFAIAGCSGSSSSGGSSDAELLPDSDNDGIVDKNDPDIDGDGILNKDDTDDDGDGTPDATDPTPNGDGGEAPTPGLVCISAKIIAPSDERPTGKYADVSWTLLPAGCGVQGGATGMATATADGLTKTSLPVNPGAAHVLVRIPHKCDWAGPKQEVTYSISQIGTALGDPSADTNTDYKQTIEHPVRACKKDPAIADNRIGRHKDASCAQEDPTSSTVTCSDNPDNQYHLWTRITAVKTLGDYQKPTWDVPVGDPGHITIFLQASSSVGLKQTCGDVAADPEIGAGVTATGRSVFFNYDRSPTGDANWEKLAKCRLMATSYESAPGYLDGLGGNLLNPKWIHRAVPGNFIIYTKGSSLEVKSYSAGN